RLVRQLHRLPAGGGVPRRGRDAAPGASRDVAGAGGVPAGRPGGGPTAVGGRAPGQRPYRVRGARGRADSAAALPECALTPAGSPGGGRTPVGGRARGPRPYRVRGARGRADSAAALRDAALPPAAVPVHAAVAPAGHRATAVGGRRAVPDRRPVPAGGRGRGA